MHAARECFLGVVVMYDGVGGIAVVHLNRRGERQFRSLFVPAMCSAWVIASLVCPVFAEDNGGAGADGESVVEVVPDEKNLAAWRDHILPDASELAFARIPWLPTFWQGIVRAGAEEKPLLLWVMNGHPLGCT